MAANDPTVTAARAEVVAAREALVAELEGLKGAARHTADVKARVAEHPERAAAAAGALGFLVLGGPRRVLRGLRSAILGQPAPMPKRMLPEEVERVLRRLGDDGEAVGAVLEREFASYVTEKKRSEGGGLRRMLVGSVLMPAATAAIKNAAKRALSGEPPPKPER